MSEDLRPIVIKRIKKGGAAHHGGAWKIAYADFVTAMMAFFLLMWLLGSTANGDLKGIADYFQNPLKVSMSGGSGSGDATSILQGGGKRSHEPFRAGQGWRCGSGPEEERSERERRQDRRIAQGVRAP
jgi:chemotaxis protein MotB